MVYFSWNLEEIVVTATKTSHLLKDVPVETVVVSKEEIEKMSVQTISDILRYILGVFVRDEDVPGITSWRTTMRGLTFNNGYGLILEDGQRVRSEGMGEYGIGLNQIPPQMIEKIEIVKGPASVLYGSDALVGVVNIITKPAPDKTIFGFEADYGSYYTNMEYIYWGTRVNKLGMLFQAGREESEMGAYGYKSTRDESFKRSTLLSKFAYNISDNLQFNLKISVQEEDRKRTDFTKGYTRISNDLKYRVSPQLKYIINNNSNFVLSGYWYDWDFRTKEYDGSSGYTPRNGDIYYKEIEMRYIRSLFNKHLFTIGTEYLQEDLDYNLSGKTLNLISSYIQDETQFSLIKPVKIVIGARIDSHSEYGTEFCPKLSSMISFNQNTKIRVSIGRGFKSPTIRQAYYNEPFQHGSYWYESNPDLKAETSWGYSFGLPVVTYKNVQSAYTQGIETEIKFAIIEKSLLLTLGYTYLDTKNKDTGKELTYVPHHDLVGHIIFNNKTLGISFDIGLQYASKMYKDIDNIEEIESYSILDMKLIKRVKKRAYLSIEGNNILNSDYGEPDREWLGSTWLVRFKMDFD